MPKPQLTKKLFYGNITTPSLSFAHAQCRNPKKVCKMSTVFLKTIVLCQSIYLISLCLGVWDQPMCQGKPNYLAKVLGNRDAIIYVIQPASKKLFLVKTLLKSVRKNSKNCFYIYQNRNFLH